MYDYLFSGVDQTTTYTVVGVGSSVGNGAGASAEAAPSALLVDALNWIFTTLPNISFEEENLSVGGQVVTQFDDQFATMQAQNPAFVTITAGMNDFMPGAFNSGQTITAVPQATRDLFDDIEGANAVPLMFTSPHPHLGRTDIGMGFNQPIRYPFLSFDVQLHFTFDSAAGTIAHESAFRIGAWSGDMIEVGSQLRIGSGAAATVYTVTAISEDRTTLSLAEPLELDGMQTQNVRHVGLDPETFLWPTPDLSRQVADWGEAGVLSLGDVRFGIGNDMLRELAAERDIPLLDAERYFFQNGVDLLGYDALYDDGQYNHPNATGYELSYGAAIHAFLAEIHRVSLSADQVSEAASNGQLLAQISVDAPGSFTYRLVDQDGQDLPHMGLRIDGNGLYLTDPALFDFESTPVVTLYVVANDGTQDRPLAPLTLTVADTAEVLHITGTFQDLGVAEREIHGDAGDNLIVLHVDGGTLADGGAGDDTLQALAGDVTLRAGSGDDLLLGGLGHDILQAGTGDDTLLGNAGDDTLIAGQDIHATQVLEGGAGADAYVIRAGVGSVEIIDDDDTSRLIFEGIEITDLDVYYETPDTLVIETNGSQIIWDGANADVLSFAFGADHVTHNFVVAREADSRDVLRGTTDSDYYTFDQWSGNGWQYAVDSDGSDIFVVDASDMNVALHGGGAFDDYDTVFLRDLDVTEVTIQRWHPRLYDSVIIRAAEGLDFHVHTDVDRYVFEDGRVIHNLELHTVNWQRDTLTGTALNDYFSLDDWNGEDRQSAAGGAGDDVYVIRGHASGAWIKDDGPDQGTDLLILRDVDRADVSIEAITWNGAEGLHFSSDAGLDLIVTADIEHVRFGDGTELQTIALARDADTREVLRGSTGNDLFDFDSWTGAGWQVALGGAGDDTYRVSAADGRAAIHEFGANSGQDTLEFTNMTIGDVSVHRWGYNSNSAIFRNDAGLDLHVHAEIETYLFADGHSYDTVCLGRQGNDRMLSTEADEILMGGRGDDTFVFRDGFGNDMISDFESRDVLDLSALSGITGFADLQANHLRTMEGHAVIEDAAGNSLILTNTALAELSVDQFVF